MKRASRISFVCPDWSFVAQVMAGTVSGGLLSKITSLTSPSTSATYLTDEMTLSQRGLAIEIVDLETSFPTIPTLVKIRDL